MIIVCCKIPGTINCCESQQFWSQLYSIFHLVPCYRGTWKQLPQVGSTSSYSSQIRSRPGSLRGTRLNYISITSFAGFKSLSFRSHRWLALSGHICLFLFLFLYKFCFGYCVMPLSPTTWTISSTLKANQVSKFMKQRKRCWP